MKPPLNSTKRITIIVICISLAHLIAVGATNVLIEYLHKTNAVTADLHASHSDNSTSSESNYLSGTESIATQTQTTTSVSDVSPKPSTLSKYISVTSKIKSSSKPKQSSSTTTSLKQQTNRGSQTDKPNTQVDSSVKTSHLKKKKVRLDVKYLAQNPELPTGCEITSLTTVLNYYGFNVNKMTMATEYLEKKPYPANFWTVFVGNPTNNSGFGCYAAPITNAANKYLKDVKANYVAKNISGSSFEQLLSYVESGTPVVIWGTMSMSKPYDTYKWQVDGTTVKWIAPEHCLVLIGYDIDSGVAILSDPQKGIKNYKLDIVKSRFLALHSQCVILEEIKKDVSKSSSSDVKETSSISNSSSTTNSFTVNNSSLTSSSSTAKESSTTKESSAVSGNSSVSNKISSK